VFSGDTGREFQAGSSELWFMFSHYVGLRVAVQLSDRRWAGVSRLGSNPA
jgi:hypothetical protein